MDTPGQFLVSGHFYEAYARECFAVCTYFGFCSQSAVAIPFILYKNMLIID